MSGSGPAPASAAPPSGGNIPATPPPNPLPESSNALGNTTASASGPTGKGLKSLISGLSSGSIGTVLLGIFAFVWVVFGLAGFVMSLWCIGFTGNAGEKIIGVLISIILGPWYWLYFYSVPSYCARLPSPMFF
jgi:hypothetical protein